MSSTTPSDTSHNSHTPPSVSRRQFLQSTALAGAAVAAGAWSMPASSYARIMGANARLNVAFIGVGGIAGGQHIPQMEKFGAGCPAFCDADSNRWENAAKRWPDAKGYTDYRDMYDNHHKDFDAVMVGTPDHHHYPATIIAMMLGKHVYTQKPLTHTVWEARQLEKAMHKYKVATQMGNQGHASDSLRVTIDYIRGGAIGDLKEAHVWTDRPWWRQGQPRVEGSEAIPANMNWDAWIGPAPLRPYRHNPADRWGGLYHPFNWRGFWDFGCGGMGDMACHELDPIYWAMLPGSPVSMELVDSEPINGADQYKSESTVKYHFAADGDRPAFDMYWREGGRKPPRQEEMADDVEYTIEGALYIGTKGKMLALKDPRAAPVLLPASRHEAYGTPKQQIERSEGHHKEWYLACIGEKPYDYPKGNFAYSAPFTEMILLGCIAQQVGGKLYYDKASGQFTNNDVANSFITKTYRRGWEFKM
jgi:predicted dehydrogenase